MKVEAWHPVIAHRKVWQEGYCPAVACAEDDVVDIRKYGSVFKMHGTFYGTKVCNRPVALDGGVAESMIAKVGMVFSSVN